MFGGCLVALITPFRDGKVDEGAFRELVEWVIAEGVDGVVPCGTTGESPTLSHAEHMRVIDLCIEVARGKVPVIAGTGSNATEEAIALTRHAKEAGADAALIVVPYYNKPTQEGLYLHYKAIHDSVGLPIIVYEIPGRSVVSLSVETLARLAALPHLVGIKDASNELSRPTRTRGLLGEGFCQLSGEDGTQLGFLAQGGHGCISVTANVAPRLCAELHRRWRDGDAAGALAIHERLMPLHAAMFIESNPIPVKYAASLIGRCSGEVRLPLTAPAPTSRARIEEAMRAVGVLG